MLHAAVPASAMGLGHGLSRGLAIGGALSFDALAFLANFDAGAIATAITFVGGSAVGVYCLYITQSAKANAEARRITLEASKDDMLAELERIRAESRDLAVKVTELTDRLKERDTIIITQQNANDGLMADLLEVLPAAMATRGYIVEPGKLTGDLRVVGAASSDEIPVTDGPP